MSNIKTQRHHLSIITLFSIVCTLLLSCQQQEAPEPSYQYSDDIYSLKQYKVERHPTVVRNGFGMDIYHEGNSTLDTMYLSGDLPSYHPNAPFETGISIKKQCNGLVDSALFNYDLLFYNELAYIQNETGDYNGTGYPVIFMYTNTINPDSSTKATMVGIGVDFFNAFSFDSITPARLKSLSSDPLVDLPSLRTQIHTSSINGTLLLCSSVESLYQSLAIGVKFRPGMGGIITNMDADDETQINFQPVFLIKTREGLYAKFMVTRFKGVGADTQKLNLQWQALKKQ